MEPREQVTSGPQSGNPGAPDEDAAAGTSQRTPGWAAGVCDRVKKRLAAPAEIRQFKELYLAEARQMGTEVPAKQVVSLKGPAGEPWISFTPKDRFGLALSGGGIRSATFNLGLLQALAQLGILQHVDYLATVSGGGYVGGFWTAWLKRQKDRIGTARFPLGGDQRGGERHEVRHLREFSRFLLPRMGVLETEFWAIAMTVLAGLLPSLVAALAVLATVWYGWGFLLSTMASTLDQGWIWLMGFVFLYLVTSEVRWRAGRKSEHNWREGVGYGLGCALFLSLFWVLTPRFLFRVDLAELTSLWDVKVLAAPVAVLGSGTLALMGLRTVLARFLHQGKEVSLLTGAERSATRALGLTTGVAVFGGCWWVAGIISQGTEMWRDVSLAAGGSLTAALAGVFAWAKKWLSEPPKETRGGNVLTSILVWLKRATPKVLASLIWLLLFLLVGALVQIWSVQNQDAGDFRLLLPLIGSLGILAITALVFDPARVGMHEFYRSRISRCYLGASNPKAADDKFEYQRAAANRHVAERPDDDMKLSQLGEVPRPVHLICVAANDLSGDPLGNLYRGARSAVLSAQGITLGDETSKLQDLRLSSALTASAAAFNSQMGRISIDLGPAVTFLMSALNLRLGLWVPHPRNPRRGEYLFPGRFFLAELLGISRTDRKHLHLSDGNHFENFGLYELIRRHCRYILVSDCGADPDVAFDDLANVLRRIREDFGVEIDLDVRPLQPGEEGLVRQHAVVGTIHYNGPTGMDKGTLLYFKPVLTGDEPPDVRQYQTRNPTFPHESTGDQFYDEAQWESYRRLGEHAGRVVLGYFEKPEMKETNQADRLFRDARSRWHPTPPHQDAEFLDMTERCAALESDLMSQGPLQLRLEFFPEAGEFSKRGNGNPAATTRQSALTPPHSEPEFKSDAESGSQSGPAPATEADRSSNLVPHIDLATGAPTQAPPIPDLEEELKILSYLMRLIQIMEDVWLAANLDTYWSHPLNEGWMNYFQRWAATPSFRRWWPVLGSIYGPGFREFAKERFGVGIMDLQARPGDSGKVAVANLSLHEVTDLEGFKQNRLWKEYRQCQPTANLDERKAWIYELALLDYHGKLSGHSIPVGFVLVEERQERDQWIARWQAKEFFVPPALHGVGIVARLLDALIARYKNAAPQRCARCEVVYCGSGGAGLPKRRLMGPAQRYAQVKEIEFYKSRGFHYVRPEDPLTGEITLVLPLNPLSPVD